MSRAYYNEIDLYCADWLANLMRENLIAKGDIDTRPIQDVRPVELTGYTQCHFFAGLGGWSYALRRAAWPDDRPVWTGSCPCQPFSQAGKRRGFADDRHLWPYWHWLIERRRPPKIYGEQVANAPAWLRLVRSDLDALGFTVRAVPIEAASAGADHLRDRYWFVADAKHAGEGRRGLLGPLESSPAAGERPPDQFTGPSNFFLADTNDTKWRAEKSSGHDDHGQTPGWRQSDGYVTERGTGGLPHADEFERRFGNKQSTGQFAQQQQDQRNCVGALQHAAGDGWGEGWTEHELRSRGITASVAVIGNSQVVECPDGKWRRLPPPRVRWLGTGLPARIPKLRAFGNAIDPRPAIAFIKATS